MEQSKHILNWKLLKGSHEFPGPEGGTCINEAAVIAAGFKYREVVSVDDCPLCFSRVVSIYALALNDHMPDDVRQKLLPFVVRLAGTARDNAMEIERAKFLAIETVKRILPPLLRKQSLLTEAAACEKAENLSEAVRAANVAARAAGAADADAAYAAYAAAYAADAYAACAADDAAADYADYAAYAYAAAGAADDAADAAITSKLWDEALRLLDECIEMAPGEVIDGGLASKRLKEALPV